jgi:hypothetical protein
MSFSNSALICESVRTAFESSLKYSLTISANGLLPDGLVGLVMGAKPPIGLGCL